MMLPKHPWRRSWNACNLIHSVVGWNVYGLLLIAKFLKVSIFIFVFAMYVFVMPVSTIVLDAGWIIF